MNDMERRKFEDSFQEAFREAEVNPSETVWTNIELDLEKAAGDRMKRRLFFFKTLAAASIIFAMCVAGIGYYFFWEADTIGNLAKKNGSAEGQQGSTHQDQAEGAPLQESQPMIEPLTDNKSEDSSRSSVDQHNESADSPSETSTHHQARALDSKIDISPATSKPALDGSGQENLARKNVEKEVQPTDPAFVKKSNSDTNPSRVASESGELGTSRKVFSKTEMVQNPNEITHRSNELPLSQSEKQIQKPKAGGEHEGNRELPLFYEPKLPELQLPGTVADPGVLLLARLAEEERRYSSEQKKKDTNANEKLWTAVGFSAGGFNANNPSVSAAPSNSMYAMNAYNTAAKQSQASGVSYSIGVSMGTRLSDRWVLQGGINYLTQSSDYTANSVVVVGNNYEAPKAESLNAFAAQTLDVSAQPKIAQTFPYNVNNDVRFVSVPLQAGFLVIDRKFGLQMNAGVSTDLFLQNTITPDGGGVTKTIQGRGEDSPYRSLNFSGLMGTELSYKLGYRYRVSVNPGLRYPFSSVYKSNTGVDSTPLTFDVGLRFRYIFH